jgi:surfactin synthase thioesterase subunit
MAHKGIYQSVHKELDAVKEAIKNCDVNEKTYFVLTGHSLGGGLATMLYTYMKTKSEYQNNRMIVVTFGAPLVLAPSDNGMNVFTNNLIYQI